MWAKKCPKIIPDKSITYGDTVRTYALATLDMDGDRGKTRTLEQHQVPREQSDNRQLWRQSDVGNDACGTVLVPLYYFSSRPFLRFVQPVIKARCKVTARGKARYVTPSTGPNSPNNTTNGECGDTEWTMRKGIRGCESLPPRNSAFLQGHLIAMGHAHNLVDQRTFTRKRDV
ncbi:uncharacterized protein LOC143895883 [Temnothorax americanus]|uniref:uncharacterized protein LOC143895883 n=1 Tax=Temnothorax americanus TaxID=1964332 RepID=UPI00406974D9